MTRGFKSSEFYITAACLITASLMAFFGQGENIAAAMAVPLVYVGGRSAVKSFKGSK